jgi:hypothetical protein
MTPDSSAAEEGHLDRNARHSLVKSGSLYGDAASKARPPNTDACGIDPGQADSEGDRISEIGNLLGRVNF